MIKHNNPYFSVNLLSSYYSLLFHQEQAIVLTTVENNFFLFVKAKRHLLKDSTIEFPSGSIKNNESIRKGATREIFEETGIKINSSKRLKKGTALSVVPSRFSQKLNVFYLDIKMDEFINKKKHDNEIDEVFLSTFEETKQLIINGDIYVMGTLSLILKYFISKEKINVSK